jgi:hypothetical protein
MIVAPAPMVVTALLPAVFDDDPDERAVTDTAGATPADHVTPSSASAQCASQPTQLSESEQMQQLLM